MEFSLVQIDDLCKRIDDLWAQLASGGISGPREDGAVAEIVQAIQRMGEGIAWAYNQGEKRGLGEQFAQPFVDRRMRDLLKGLLTDRDMLRRDSQNRLAAQVLQTIHILLQATPEDSTLYCNLTAGWYLNDVISAEFDFQENEDLLPLWMTVVKEIATMLTKDNMMLFFDPGGPKPFPIFSEAVCYYHHPVAQVRTHVQATSLEIFAKLRDEPFWEEPYYQQVLAEYFTHVACLLREFWTMADQAVRSGARRDVRNALHIQNDILMYAYDVLTCDIRIVTEILQEKLLRFAILPVLLRSALPSREMLAPSTAWYFLHDALTTLRSPAVASAVASTLLRAELPEEVLRLVLMPPLRTPTQYRALQAGWGSHGTPGSSLYESGSVSDEALYQMPPTSIATLLARGASGMPPTAGRKLVHNTLLESLQAYLESVARGLAGSQVSTATEASAMAPPTLGVVTLLLRTTKSSHEPLAEGLPERLGATLCAILALHRQVRWASLEAAAYALRELVGAADMPAGRSRIALGSALQERVIAPLALELLESTRRLDLVAQQSWLDEFQEQWYAHRAAPSEPPPVSEHELLDQGTHSANVESLASPLGRSRCLRVLFWTRQLALGLGFGKGPEAAERMPVLDDLEADEAARYQPGVAVNLGQQKRLKCTLLRPGGTMQDKLFLLHTQAVLVLARPDHQKVFFGVPVVVEPIRCVRLLIDEKTGGALEQISLGPHNGEEAQSALRLEVSWPQSPVLLETPVVAAGAPSVGRAFVPTAGPSLGTSSLVVGDALAMTLQLPSAGGSGGVPGAVPGDRIASSVPAAPSLALDGALSRLFGSRAPSITGATLDDGQSTGAPSLTGAPSIQPGQLPTSTVPLALLFQEERRRRVACKILAQARKSIGQRMLGSITAFLEECSRSGAGANAAGLAGLTALHGSGGPASAMLQQSMLRGSTSAPATATGLVQVADIRMSPRVR